MSRLTYLVIASLIGACSAAESVDDCPIDVHTICDSGQWSRDGAPREQIVVCLLNCPRVHVWVEYNGFVTVSHDSCGNAWLEITYSSLGGATAAAWCLERSIDVDAD
jgi:hypothetical protein